MQLAKLDLKSLFFLILLLALSVLLVNVFSPFLNVIVIALVIVQLFHPIYKKIHQYLHNQGLASLITTALTILLVVIPLVLIILLALTEIGNIVNNISQNVNVPETIKEIQHIITQIVVEINRLLTPLGISNIDTNSQLLSPQNLQDALTQALNLIQSLFLGFTKSILEVLANGLFYGILLILTLIYLFIEYERLPQHFSRLSPLDNKLDNILFRRFTDTTTAVIKGSFLVAIAQATAVLVVMLIMDIGSPVLLWIIMVLLSLIPVGSGVVWIPVGLLLIANGRPLEGIALIIYSAIIINVIDALLRPILLKGKMQLHPLVILFSVLGGLFAFGPLGILYGPLIAVFFAAFMDVYLEHFSGDHSVE
jgi:predicted PurR-regulated permease PerM